MSTEQQDAEYVEIWGDRVSMRDMALSLVVCGVATALAVGVGHLLRSSEFFWGLGGAVVGFVVAATLVRPKRDVQIVDDPRTAPDVVPPPEGSTPLV